MIALAARSRNFKNALLVLFAAVAVYCIPTANIQAGNRRAEQALIVTIPIADGRPDSPEVKSVYRLEDDVIKVIAQSGAGEYDGNEIREHAFIMYVYGPSADKLFGLVQPILAKYPLPSGSRAVRRYGQPGAREERIQLDKPTPSTQQQTK